MTSLRLDCVLASSRDGRVVRELNEDGALPLLHELAAILPEVLGSMESSSLSRVAALLDPGGSDAIAEVLLLSESHVHVISPLPDRGDQALLAIAPGARSVGLVLSQVHARAVELGSEP